MFKEDCDCVAVGVGLVVTSERDLHTGAPSSRAGAPPASKRKASPCTWLARAASDCSSRPTVASRCAPARSARSTARCSLRVSCSTVARPPLHRRALPQPPPSSPTKKNPQMRYISKWAKQKAMKNSEQNAKNARFAAHAVIHRKYNNKNNKKKLLSNFQ